MPLQVGDKPPVVQSTSSQIQKADDDRKDPNKEWSARLVDQLIADYNNSDKVRTLSELINFLEHLLFFFDNVLN